VISVEQIDLWLTAREDEHTEFKEARTSFPFDELVRYVAALANEKGGYLVLGISPKLPRKVVDSQAFRNLQDTVHGVLQRINLRVEAEEVQHPGGRVVVFEVPPRPVGTPLEVGGTYWMRAGGSVTGMTPDKLKRIFDEAIPDYSAVVCPEASMDALDPGALDRFRSLWQEKSGNEALAELSPAQLLEDAGLLVNGGVTVAALVLLGTKKALARNLPQVEVIFEYRSDEQPGPANQRVEFRQGFLSFFDDLWNLINLRNDLQHYQEGFLIHDIPTFDERVCREAILNAVSHRDYRSGGIVFVRQFPRHLVIESPGGFPDGITADNMLFRQQARNSLLADSLARCGFVERAGQGADLMFRRCIEQGKPRPDFTNTDAYWVFLTLHGNVSDPQFVRFLEQVARKRGASFGIRDLMILSLVHEGESVPPDLQKEVGHLLDHGVIERVGRKRLALSRKFYRFLRKPGEYTRRRGLDHETNKELLLRHVRDSSPDGACMEELLQVLPALTRPQVKYLMQELRRDNRVRLVGVTRAARWLPTPDPMDGLDGNYDEFSK